MKTTVVHCQRDDYDEYIGRPTLWGNPFEIGKDGTRKEVIAKYRAYILSNPFLLARLHRLKGKRLGCWCSPKICHGHVIAELADMPSGPAVWHAKDHDMPVNVTGIMGLGSDDKIYMRTDSGCGVPFDELTWPEAKEPGHE